MLISQYYQTNLERQERRCLVHSRRDRLGGHFAEAFQGVSGRHTSRLLDHEVEPRLQLRKAAGGHYRARLHPARTEERFGVAPVGEHLERHGMAARALAPAGRYRRSSVDA